MFTALKKLTSKSDSQNQQNVLPETAGKTMSGSLQKKFSKGVQYNMKIIIKGDNNVGKTCLFQRLQGKSFIEQYTPSEQIQVTSIQWSFKATEDIVKVEVWDVVDRGKARTRNTGLKGIGKEQEQPVLDAEFLDVYKSTHGVILMMDITKSWTFDYVTREISKIPKEMPVLILGNHCDMAHHRVIIPAQVTGLIEEVSSNRSAEILYAESSMRNGFGLRLLHKFLGLPFLQLQKDTLKSLMERNLRDTDICIFEISEFLKSDDADYSKFLDNLVNKRRQVADSNSSVIPSNAIGGANIRSPVGNPNSAAPSTSSIATTSSQATSMNDFKFTKSIIVGGGKPIVIPGQTNITNDPKYRNQITSAMSANASTGSNTISKVTSSTAKDINNLALTDSSKITKIEEFCPEGGIVLDKSFLDESGLGAHSTDFASMPTNNTVVNDSDSENEIGNPLVAQFEEDDVLTNFSETYVGSSTEKNEKLQQNPLIKINKKYDRKASTSSFEIDINRSGNSQEPKYSDDEYNNWSIDTKMRRSPEGGEDSATTPNLIQDSISVPSIEHRNDSNNNEQNFGAVSKDEDLKKIKKKKVKDKDKERKKRSDKSSSKDKERKKSSNKNSGKSSEIDFEEFLNGRSSPINDDAYESF